MIKTFFSDLSTGSGFQELNEIHGANGQATGRREYFWSLKETKIKT